MEWVSVIRQLQLACQPAATMRAEFAAFEAAEGADLDTPSKVGSSQSPRTWPAQRQ
jgi:hypothetical protein